jgi:PHD/YefM family antitoxin component YafN of YafNO toxin-antitoxin module
MQLTLAEAQQRLLELPDQLTDDPLIITRDGQPVMAAIRYEQLASLLETLDILSDSLFAERLKQSVEQAQAGESISWDEAKRQLEL